MTPLELEFLANRAKSSSRRVSNALRIPLASVHRIFSGKKIRPFKPCDVQQLHQDHIVQRLEFCVEFEEKIWILTKYGSQMRKFSVSLEERIIKTVGTDQLSSQMISSMKLELIHHQLMFGVVQINWSYQPLLFWRSCGSIRVSANDWFIFHRRTSKEIRQNWFNDVVLARWSDLTLYQLLSWIA